MNNKGAAAVTVLGILLIIVLLGWAYTSFSGECRSDTSCTEGFYCGVDKECHAIPIIEKEVTKNSFLLPSIIIAAAIIIGSVLVHLSKLQEDREIQDHYSNYYQQWYESQVGQPPQEEHSHSTIDEPIHQDNDEKEN